MPPTDSATADQQASNPPTSLQLSGWTLVFVFNHAGEVLLLRRSVSKRLLPGIVNGVGGRIEPTDATPEAAARREVLEETGLLVEALRLRGTLMARRGDDAAAELSVIYVFTAHHFTGTLHVVCPEGELFWSAVADVLRQPTTRELQLYWPRVVQPAGVFHVWTDYHAGQPGQLILA